MVAIHTESSIAYSRNWIFIVFCLFFDNLCDICLKKKNKTNLYNIVHACWVAKLCLNCDPMDYSLPGSSVHGIFHPKYCSGLPLLPPEDLPDAGIKHTSPVSPALAGRFFTTEPLGKPPTISYGHLKRAIYFSRIISKNVAGLKDDYFI